MNTLVKNTQPFFIFVEGADGVGKSTTTALLKKVLEEYYEKKVDTTLIMQSTEAGTILRNIAIKEDDVSDELKFLSYCFSTFYALDKLKNSKEGFDFVLVDRSHASTFAQSICAANVEETTKTSMIGIFDVLNSKFKKDYLDRYLFVNLKASAKGALERMQQSRKELDLFEKRGIDYQEKIAKSYETFYKNKIQPKNVLSLDTEKDNPETIISKIISCLVEKGKI